MPVIEGVIIVMQEEESRNVPIELAVADLGCKNGFVRVNARKYLVYKAGEAVPYLVSALKSDQKWVRWEAAKALGQIGDPEATQALVEALEDDMFDVRWLAAEGLVATGRSALVPLLQALNRRGDSLWLREGAHHVLHDLVTEKVKDIFEPILVALERPETRLAVPIAAKEALERLGHVF